MTIKTPTHIPVNRESESSEQKPWGHFEILDTQNGYQVKKLVVKPDGYLSVQSHFHRDEFWVVVSGVAMATLEGKRELLEAGDTFNVRAMEKHRIGNPGKIPLVVIEVQLGEYLGENDIKRFEDIYNRAG